MYAPTTLCSHTSAGRNSLRKRQTKCGVNRGLEAPSGLEPLFSENADPERQALEHPASSGSELNPFLARVLERVKQNEAERAR